MAKKIEGTINLQVKAGGANAAPPIGPALGQRGLNSKEFCDSFNAQTRGSEAEKDGTKLPVVITYYSDRSFTFVIKGAPATALLKKAANLKKGSATPHTVKVAKITRDQLEGLARSKMSDLNAADLAGAMKTLAGSARSMGIEVEE